MSDVTRAKLLLALCGVTWGVNWPLIKIGLTGFSPWSYRLLAFTVGALALIAILKLTGSRFAMPRGWTWFHLFVSSLLNVVAFGLFSTIAMLTATTSRVAVVSYSFPVWACLLAWLILGEKLRGGAILGLALCVGGLVLLLYPVIDSIAIVGLALSLASAMSWAVGTIYLKLVKIPGDVLANTAWQLAIAAVFTLACTLLVQGWPSFEPAPAGAIAAVMFNGLGTALAYLLWYHIIGRLPATTASLGSLASPAVGVAISVAFLGERPDLGDIIGFTLIFAAAACAILQPRGRAAPPTPEPEIHR